MSWHPHVTVATIVEDQGRFLLVEEQADGREVLNQPAGHLEPAESLLEAALRETLEETGWEVELSAVTGIYLYTAPSNGVTYQRVCFAARPVRHHPERALDAGIIATNWPPSRSAGAATWCCAASTTTWPAAAIPWR